ncbi:stomatin-related, partial [Clonorchis sinensis]
IVSGKFCDFMSTSMTLYFVGAKCIPKDGMTLISSFKNTASSSKTRTRSSVYSRGHLNTGVHPIIPSVPKSNRNGKIRMELDTESFEWELSKENVTQLRGGRSVTLLNKVLSSQNSHEFQLKRLQLRHRKHSVLSMHVFCTSVVCMPYDICSEMIQWLDREFTDRKIFIPFERTMYACARTSDSNLSPEFVIGLEIAQWLGCEHTDRKVPGSKSTSGPRLFLSRIG